MNLSLCYKNIFHAFFLVFLVSLVACGSNPNSSSDTGSIAFQLEWERPPQQVITSTSPSVILSEAKNLVLPLKAGSNKQSLPVTSAAGDICIDYGITTVSAKVINSSNATVASGSWTCSAHQGTISNVPAGSNYTIRLEGTVSGQVMWRGEKTGISISAGSTTNAGTITMSYIGPAWMKSTVDNIGDVGSENYIAIDSNNNVHISYRDDTNRDLKYATNASGSWVIYTIDSVGDVGSHPSIAIDSNNKVHISYFDWNNWDLKYATNASDSWAIFTIDSVGNVGLGPSIGIDSDNKVHISYCDYDNAVRNLKYATNASGSWVTSSIGSAWESSIAIDSNNKVHISYFDWTDLNLKYITNASGSWVTSTIDYRGRKSSIAVDSNNKVHISYYDEININLKYATYATNVSGTLIITTIERVENMGHTTSIAINSNNKVYISYGTNDYLKYATNAYGLWVSSIIDSSGDLYTSVAIDSNDKVHISYYDVTNRDLKYTTNQ